VKKAISDVLSYEVPGAHFAKIPGWDGRNRLMKKDGTYPTGLTSNLVKYFREEKLEYRFRDFRVKPEPKYGFEINCGERTPRYYQNECAEISNTKPRGVYLMGTGAGKCHEPDAPILMFDGHIKKAKDVVEGDLLMGPDSTARRVLVKSKGFGKLCRVTPIKGDSHVFNEDHIITLISSFSKNQVNAGDIVDVEIKEWLKWSKSKKRQFKWYRSNGVEWTHREVFNPYLMGLYLGDGAVTHQTITNGDKEIQEYLEPMAKRVWEETNCWGYSLALTDRKEFRKCLSPDGKFIPQEYKINSRAVRLEILAGLIDTDGYLSKSGYEITTKYEALRDDILFICRSLGLAAYSSKKYVKLSGWTEARVYQRVFISGEVSAIPCRVARKKAPERKQIKSVTSTGFEISQVEEGEYHGWVIDGDRRYLMGDFTITHNTLTSALIVDRKKVDTLFVTPDTGLRQQVYNDYAQWFGPSNVSTDIESGAAIIISNIQSLARKDDKLFKRFGLLIVDEFHHSSASTYLDLNKACVNAYYRYGFTGTFIRSDGIDMPLHGVLSNVIFRKTTSELIEEGFLVRPYITVREVVIPKNKMPYAEAYSWITEYVPFNQVVAEDCCKTVKEGKQTLVLVRRKEHGKSLAAMIPGAVFVSGKDRGAEREKIKRDFIDKKIRCMVATEIFGEGQDIPSIDVLVNARLQKTEIQTAQGIGRALRKNEGKDKAEVYDYLIVGQKHLYDHSLQRIASYKKESAFVLQVIREPRLIK